MKRFFYILLCVCMIIGMLPGLHVFAASPESDFVFDPATGTITGYTGPGGDVEIPGTIGGIAVAVIGYRAFLESSITSLMIPDGVISIGVEAFVFCDNLTVLSIPDSVITMGDRAFSHCSGLTSIHIPRSVAAIGKGVWEYCFNLSNITVVPENSVYKSEDNCLIERGTNKLVAGCKASIIPDYITIIGEAAFHGRSGLTNINIPTGVTTIERVAFGNCYDLVSVNIPESVTKIGEFAFADCTGLTGLTLSKNINRIGSYAFQRCAALTGIIVHPDNTVYKSEGNCLIETASNKIILGCNASVIPEYITVIGEHAFENCSGLTNINIPEGVTIIERWAFQGCGFSNIVVPCSVIAVNEFVFNFCPLTSITFESSATSIYDLESTIPITAKIIGYDPSTAKDYAVKYGRTFEVISSPGSNFVFDPATGTITGYTGPGGDVVIPSTIGGISVTSIGDTAFYGIDLTSITIPDSVTSIGDDAFFNCPIDFTIYGFSGSYAETYANDHGYNFTAIKITPVITTNPAASAITYGQTLTDSILTGGTASVDGVFTWTDDSITPAVSDSGTTLYGVTFTPEDTLNYENTATEIMITVGKATPVVLLEDYNVKYNGKIIEIKDAEVILVNGEIYNGSVSYTYYTDPACTKLTQRIHGAIKAGSAPRNNGVYYVKASVDETGNYTAATSDTAKLTISLLMPATYYTITASAGVGGSISPLSAAVRQNTSKIFYIVPKRGFKISAVLVDGISVGNVRYYIFSNVTGDHTIQAEFIPVK